MNRGEFEQLMGMCCAPTFAGLKSGSLISFPKNRFANVDLLLEEYEPCFHCKGISIMSMADNPRYRVDFFYRPAALSRLLEASGAKDILKKSGYPLESTLHEKLSCLRMRMSQNNEFPHEIGLFLGYPPDDVRGFIEHQGKDFLFCGYWKVYANEKIARELFQCYTQCTERFCSKLQRGVPIHELLQAI